MVADLVIAPPTWPVTLELSSSVFDVLVAQSRARGRDVADLVAEALQEFFLNHPLSLR